MFGGITNKKTKVGDGWDWAPDGKFKLLEKGNYSDSDLKDPAVIKKLKKYVSRGSVV